MNKVLNQSFPFGLLVHVGKHQLYSAALNMSAARRPMGIIRGEWEDERLNWKTGSLVDGVATAADGSTNATVTGRLLSAVRRSWPAVAPVRLWNLVVRFGDFCICNLIKSTCAGQISACTDK